MLFSVLCRVKLACSKLTRSKFNRILTCYHPICSSNRPKSGKQTLQIFENAEDAISDITEGSTILVGGFGLCGVPENLIDALVASQVKNLIAVSNNAAIEGVGLGKLLRTQQIKRMISSYTGQNAEFEKMYQTGSLELELVPQGTLAERIRAGGAGIPAFYTPVGQGILIEIGGVPIKFKPDGKVALSSEARECRMFKGKNYILEEAIRGDFALIKAWKADKAGNLVFEKSSQNFNVPMSKAANVTIVEVEEIVDVGEISPEYVHVPGIYVNCLVKTPKYEKRIEKLTLKKDGSKKSSKHPALELREKIAKRAFLELSDGMSVNFGSGIPTMVRDYVFDQNKPVCVYSENGIARVGPYPNKGEEDSNLINADMETVTVLPGSTYLASDESFAIVRGGHLDAVFVTALEVSQYGDIAGWFVPGKPIKGMNSLMDLVSSHSAGTKVIILMEHTGKGDKHKILPSCTLPLMGKNCADIIITEKCVFTVDQENGLILTEISDGVTVQDIINDTGCSFEVSPDMKTISRT